MNAKAVGIVAIASVLSIAGCKNQSQQTATSSPPTVVQAAPAAPSVPSSVPAASASSPTGSGTEKVKTVEAEKKIDGLIDPKHDKTSFIGTIVNNECGTIAKPEDCKIKEVKVQLSAPFIPEGQEELYRRAGAPPITDALIQQLTVRKQDETYLTFACAYGVSTNDDGSETVFPHQCYDELDVGRQYRFGRNGNTVSYGFTDELLRENHISLQQNYYLSLGNCSSIHECQNIPRRLSLSPKWEESVAPWHWELAQKRREREGYLNTPR